jgi:hypothetical protein
MAAPGGLALRRRRRWVLLLLPAVLLAVLVPALIVLRSARLRAMLERRWAGDAELDPRAWMEAGKQACAPLRESVAAASEPVLLGDGAAEQSIAPFGALLFAYGETVELVRKYGAEAALTAEALRRTNPELPVAIATNFPNATAAPGSSVRLFRTPPFMRVLPIRHEHMVYPSTVRPRYEWVTRAHYMALSPFELTLTLDSHTLPCTADDADPEAIDADSKASSETGGKGEDGAPSAGAASVLTPQQGHRRTRPWRPGNEVAAALRALHRPVDSAERWFDMAFNTFLTTGRPHNWALLYFTRAPAMRALFTDWYIAYLAQGGDDQGPLEHAARVRARAGALRLARLHTNFVGAFERVDDFQRSDWPRATHVLTGPAHLFHVRYGDERTRRSLCAMLNAPARARERRVLIQPRGGHKGLYAHPWPTVGSAAEYRAVTGYDPPPRGHVNELQWERPACARAPNRSAAPAARDSTADGGGGGEEAEPLVYPFEQHARLPCWQREQRQRQGLT